MLMNLSILLIIVCNSNVTQCGKCAKTIYNEFNCMDGT